MNFKYTILIIILFSMAKYSLSQVEPITEPIKTIEWQKIYRCCESKCFLLKGITNQSVAREVSRKEVYEDYDESTIIFSSRYCPKEMVFKNN